MNNVVRIERVTLGASRPSDFAPAYGVRGALTYRGRHRVQCHICGKYFSGLGIHVAQTHEMTAQDYRFEFGLPHTVGLVSEYLHERYQQGNGQRLKAYAVEAAEKARKAQHELWNDPDWARTRAERSSFRQGGLAIAVKSCVICGREFRTEARNEKKKTTCSRACSTLRRSQARQGQRWTAEAKAALSVKKRKIQSVAEHCIICGSEYETAQRGSRRSATCKSRSCMTEAVRRWHIGRKLSDNSKALISEKARRNFTPERMQQLKEARGLESSIMWQFRRVLTQRSTWTRDDVAALCGISKNHATAILSTCVRVGAMERVRRGAYRPNRMSRDDAR